ncbi:unnamed protein product [Bursaphelenchus okinawaensis]|uniref:WD_REPEATS_REGION domain-containing protein n=1 Tax=Bursaphelenchus okinawaensis TaxID=465554 RepID=A0A811KBC7_9BILA|nr:unnamed protein product [Bursaphelenchus okinawaensis]CAG9097581.1 unnamed protein product [Bursaphelenchus okinawaensis]
MEESRHTVITSICWIERGVAAEKPQYVKLEPQTISELIQGSHPENTEDDQTSDAEMEQEEPKSKGIRGSKTNLTTEEGEDKYNMEGYDKEKEVEPSMKGLSVFSSNLEDPYVTKTADSEDEAEQEDLSVKAEDNLVAAAKFEGDDTTLVVYLYNTDGDFYVHHDYPIAAPILCMEHIKYDPGVETKKGNLLAVATMNPVIELWDLDIVNAVKPLGTLGEFSKKSRKKRDGSSQGHSDAVLSLAWNREADHLLASGGADEIVVLWDLDEAKAAQNMNLEGMVQTLDWQPSHASVLLSGSRSGKVQINDCQSDESIQIFEKSGIEIEKVYWDRFNENKLFVMGSDGILRYFDARQPNTVVCEEKCHEGEGAVFSQSARNGMFSTAGDEEIKVWSLENDQFKLLNTEALNIGTVRSAAFCPNVPNVLLLGGEKKDLIRIYDVAKRQNVVNKFPDLNPAAEPAAADPNQADEEMDQ